MFLQLHHIFEADSVSFLDELERAGNLHLAQPIASEVSVLKMSSSIKLKTPHRLTISNWVSNTV